MITGGISAFKGKRILLLQGPLGPFFRRLASDLEEAGAQVEKVNFNGGDWLFYPRGAVSFRGPMETWPSFFEHLIGERGIDLVLLFGDCRPIHRIAHEIAHRRGIEIGVFEEGYVRPDYLTLERYGVNGHSSIPNVPNEDLRAAESTPPTLSVGNTYWHSVLWAILYYLASALLRPWFRHYRHHRPLTLREAWPWARSIWRKLKYLVTERGVQGELATVRSGQYFLVPLQVHNDAQVRVHSCFDSVRLFIGNVVASFAVHAPADTLLIIKHHPMDRGYRDHTQWIRLLAGAYGVQERVRYIHDQHLPTLLEHARGVVVINSTVGFSALYHGTPVKVCGAAVYDRPGLTYQGPLDDFWREARDRPVDRGLFENFRSYVIGKTQLNGNHYRPLRIPGSRAGLVWPLAAEEGYGAPAPAQPVVPNRGGAGSDPLR